MSNFEDTNRNVGLGLITMSSVEDTNRNVGFGLITTIEMTQRWLYHKSLSHPAWVTAH